MTFWYNVFCIMAKNSTKQQEINRRRQIISRLKSEGVKRQDDIRQRLSDDFGITVTQQTVSLDLKALDKQWIKAQISNTDKWKRELIKQYQIIYEQSIAAWYLSLDDAEEITFDEEGNEANRKVKGQSGNPALLSQAQNALKNIRDILGLDEAQKLNLNDGKPIEFKHIIVNIPDVAMEDTE